MRLRSKEEGRYWDEEGEARRKGILGEEKEVFAFVVSLLLRVLYRWLGLEFMRCISLEKGVFLLSLRQRSKEVAMSRCFYCINHRLRSCRHETLTLSYKFR
jgi:hypothetical protein